MNDELRRLIAELKLSYQALARMADSIEDCEDAADELEDALDSLGECIDCAENALEELDGE